MARTFEGRIFMKPLAKSRGQSAEVYVNVGWVASGSQGLPPYDARLEAACSQEQWDDLMASYKAFHDEKSVPEWMPIVNCFLCPFTLGLTCCLTNAMIYKYTSGLELITKEKTKSWKCPARFENVRLYGPAGEAPDQIPYDQYGQPLLAMRGKPGDKPFAEWPPAGCNLVINLNVRAEEFAQQWLPQGPVAPMQIGMA
ncbi:unnamed protein product [Durusdinium trenchii]|uniref:Uncharacterized protein n=2 Tax=Durusdinium trenchii TaxID=1381693 RepID=A0ABP0J4T1_9DINO